MIKGIRGAITAEENSIEALKAATVEVLNELITTNNIENSKISHVIFTLTNDLDAAFPAKFAREEVGFTDVAMMCFNELDVQNAIEKCLRVLIVLNCDENFSPKHVYLKGAKILRPDIN